VKPKCTASVISLKEIRKEMDTCFLLWSVEKLIAASAAAARTLS
jgi:hypothetical protein